MVILIVNSYIVIVVYMLYFLFLSFVFENGYLNVMNFFVVIKKMKRMEVLLEIVVNNLVVVYVLLNCYLLLFNLYLFWYFKFVIVIMNKYIFINKFEMFRFKINKVCDVVFFLK